MSQCPLCGVQKPDEQIMCVANVLTTYSIEKI